MIAFERGGLLFVPYCQFDAAMIQSIFSQNVVAVIFFLALHLNLILPKDMEDHTAE